MKKDKEWLKEQLTYLQEGVGESFNDYSKGLNAAYNTIGLLINELEEPEQEKVVVPQFVGDFITEIKPNFNIRAVFTLQNNKHEQGQEWALDNPDVFARAWIDGYSVEKEKLYRVKLLPINRGYLAQWDGTSLQTGYADEHECYENCKTIFTEQEIKAFDERFWTFAEEITE